METFKEPFSRQSFPCQPVYAFAIKVKKCVVCMVFGTQHKFIYRNKQLTSKFQSKVMQRIASVKSRNLGASISALHAEKPHNVAKTTPAASNLPYHKVSEKTTETSESKPKGPQNRNAGLTSVGPQVVRKANVGLTPKPGASLGSGASRSPASSRSHHFCIPVRSCYTVTSRARRSYDHGVFLYHLSQLEQTGFAKSAADPMKSVPAAELQLLHSGQRTTYLERRYARSPDDKYNYPEATSWRYGWFHRESDLLHKRVPRRD